MMSMTLRIIPFSTTKSGMFRVRDNAKPHGGTLRGFTLIEVLVVLFLIVLATMLALPRISKTALQHDPKAYRFIQAQRATAIREGKTVNVWLRNNFGLYASPGNEVYRFDKEETWEVRFPAADGYHGDRMVGSFHADGTMTGGESLWSRKGERKRIVLSPFSGLAITPAINE